eukprot:3526645-Amphidinium_carterae.1
MFIGKLEVSLAIIIIAAEVVGNLAGSVSEDMAQDIEDPKFEVVKIGPSYYRKLIIPSDLKFKTEVQSQALWDEEEEDDEVDAELDKELVYEGQEWKLRLAIPAVFHKFIVGARARNKQKIEMESGARITVPHREDNQDAIFLHARQKQAIY